MQKSNLFLVMWDNQGLECCLDITTYEQEFVWGRLSDTPAPSFPIARLMLRARQNSQRHYEIYTISTEPNITKEDLIEFFNKEPQYTVDLIRERGRQIYSNRATALPVIV